MNPSPLGNVNYLGEGLVYLIVPETMNVGYDVIDIKFAQSANSDNYISYEPPSNTSNQIKKIGAFLASMVPYVGQVLGATALLSEEINATNFLYASDYIDRNIYDAVDVIWFMKDFRYYQKVKIEIPLESTENFKIGFYANWVTKATNETSGPIFTRDNKSYPGFNLNATGNAFSTKGTFVDPRDGQEYKWVRIGNQVWMAENLNIGEMINVQETQAENGKFEKYCYDNDPENCKIYGGLYLWNEMMQYVKIEGIKGICPNGWHIPTDNEWDQLVNYLGGENIAGGKMKETGTLHWKHPNDGATNESGFTGLGGGARVLYPDPDWGTFNDFRYFTYFSSSTGLWQRRIVYAHPRVLRVEGFWTGGFSVRCIKN